MRLLPGINSSRASLAAWLGLFWLSLAVPGALLAYKAHDQLKWEAFYFNRVLAEELTQSIDANLARLVAREERRTYTDYSFLTVTGDGKTGAVQRSPLSRLPPPTEIPGVIGYFQVDDRGQLSTPIIPVRPLSRADAALSPGEFHARAALLARMRGILAENRLVRGEPPPGPAPAVAAAPRPLRSKLAAERRRQAPAEAETDDAEAQVTAALRPPAEVPEQARFDALNRREAKARAKKESVGLLGALKGFGKVTDLPLKQDFDARTAAGPAPKRNLSASRGARVEQNYLPARVGLTDALEESAGAGNGAARITTFASEIDPFEFSLLNTGHWVLYRKVWRAGKRLTQGLLINPQPFITQSIEAGFRASAIGRDSDLVVAYRGDVIKALSSSKDRPYFSSTGELSGELLYRARLSAPLGDLELIYSINRLPAGASARAINWLVGILALVLCGGFVLMYGAGARQIRLARQQQDFISAVSHELKTPLTSIRMYGEILREGWASKVQQQGYFEYILTESERLSRLIDNVLRLARLSRNETPLQLAPAHCADLAEELIGKVTAQVRQAGFELNVSVDEAVRETAITVDRDALSQIVINLVDNAIKFSTGAEVKTVDLTFARSGEQLRLSVRDYGPGVPPAQMKRIFRLFYRAGNELTRETVGTGIGLALVERMARQMEARVDVINRDPGAEFQVLFAVAGG